MSRRDNSHPGRVGGWIELPPPYGSNYLPNAGAVGNRINYIKDSYGWVSLRGLLQRDPAVGGGNIEAGTIATLPLGHRPAQRRVYMVKTSGQTTYCRVDIRADGVIECVIAAAIGQLNLDIARWLGT